MKIQAINSARDSRVQKQKYSRVAFGSQSLEDKHNYEELSFKRREYLAKAICYSAALVGVCSSVVWFWRRAKKG